MQSLWCDAIQLFSESYPDTNAVMQTRNGGTAVGKAHEGLDRLGDNAANALDRDTREDHRGE